MTARQIEAFNLVCPCCKATLKPHEKKRMLDGLIVYKKRPDAKRGNRFLRMTPEERSQDARRAVNARWGQRSELDCSKPVSTDA